MLWPRSNKNKKLHASSRILIIKIRFFRYSFIAYL